MEKLIADTRKLAKKHGIKIVLSDKDKVVAKGEKMGCNGYFDSDNRILAVATGKPIEDWSKVYIHESCHLDQFVENIFQWEKWNVGYTMFFQWINGEVELNRETLLLCWKDVVDCELDCEKRAVNKINKYKIDIPVEHYIKMCNTYLYSYTKILEVRKWKKGVYLNKKLIRCAPISFQDDYLTIPAKLNKALDEFYATE